MLDKLHSWIHQCLAHVIAQLRSFAKIFKTHKYVIHHIHVIPVFVRLQTWQVGWANTLGQFVLHVQMGKYLSLIKFKGQPSRRLASLRGVFMFGRNFVGKHIKAWNNMTLGWRLSWQLHKIHDSRRIPMFICESVMLSYLANDTQSCHLVPLCAADITVQLEMYQHGA